MGYLKPPESFRKEFDLKQSPTPVATRETGNGKIRLIFEWDEPELIPKQQRSE